MISQRSGLAPAEHVHKRLHVDAEVRACCEEILEQLPQRGGGRSQGSVTLGVTSCHRGEGVSTIAAHLAVAAAGDPRRRILLVDCNLARPSLHAALGVSLFPGLAECLRAGDVAAEVIQPAIEPGLFVMAAGQLRGSPARAYDSPALPQLLKEVSHDFELAVFDLPTAGQASCTRRLAGLLDGVLLVVESERVYWEAAQRVKELFARTGASLLGVVLNKQRERVPHWMRNKR